MMKSSSSRRPESANYAKGHRFVQKDYYRHMKSDKIVKKHLDAKKAKEMGRAPNKTLLETKNAKYQQIGQVISEQYARSQIPESRLYMIDKVVRMRGQHGRFGIDHSELLNYELEQTNKPRDDYMNMLVYKSEAQSTNARDFSNIAPVGATVSEVLFNRLNPEDKERYSDYSSRSMMGGADKQNQRGAGNLGT